MRGSVSIGDKGTLVRRRQTQRRRVPDVAGLMAMAAGMMMRIALISIGRNLIAVAAVVTDRGDRRRIEASVLLEAMRDGIVRTGQQRAHQ